jgi:hypothetical protein
MATKLNFTFNGLAEIVEDGEYSVKITSKIPHRFSLVDGKVIDKYDGISDADVVKADYAAAVALATEQNVEPPPQPF